MTGTVSVRALSKRYEVPGAGAASPLTGGPIARAFKSRFPVLTSDAEREWFWALRDASFELDRGEVLGIIGRNGAGKSTLLKLLAGIVTPSHGNAELAGRVASLLEIGTGFHPDLSGRENVLLSAALLGISRADVLREFDAIVDYAGVASFIDVPVKRYSSGMYMRLAYAVTALLRSDILLLDEVLAVGDAEFQKKTKRNVDNIAHDGRTVLFVSHSMGSITSMCTRCIWLEHGRIIMDGPPEEITDRYLKTIAPSRLGGSTDIAEAPPRVDVSRHLGYYTSIREEPVLRWVETLRGDGTPARTFATGDAIRVRVDLDIRGRPCDFIAVAFHTLDDRRITAAYSHGRGGLLTIPEQGVVECTVPHLQLITGDYSLILEAGRFENGDLQITDSVSDASQIRMDATGYVGFPGLLRNQGHIAQRADWHNHPSIA